MTQQLVENSTRLDIAVDFIGAGEEPAGDYDAIMNCRERRLLRSAQMMAQSEMLSTSIWKLKRRF